MNAIIVIQYKKILFTLLVKVYSILTKILNKY